MALFGAPIAHEDHAQRACHAALAIQQALVPYGEEMKRQLRDRFQDAHRAQLRHGGGGDHRG